mgnify:FL=1
MTVPYTKRFDCPEKSQNFMLTEIDDSTVLTKPIIKNLSICA